MWAAATKILIYSTVSVLAFKVAGLSPNQRRAQSEAVWQQSGDAAVLTIFSFSQ